MLASLSTPPGAGSAPCEEGSAPTPGSSFSSSPCAPPPQPTGSASRESPSSPSAPSSSSSFTSASGDGMLNGSGQPQQGSRLGYASFLEEAEDNGTWAGLR
ncbi:unnamed protein product [Ixodes pacificus]